MFLNFVFTRSASDLVHHSKRLDSYPSDKNPFPSDDFTDEEDLEKNDYEKNKRIYENGNGDAKLGDNKPVSQKNAPAVPTSIPRAISNSSRISVAKEIEEEKKSSPAQKNDAKKMDKEHIYANE